jgi:hypothetical protein
MGSAASTLPSKTAPAVVTPAPPAHLSETAQKQWTALYTKALAQAKLDYPDNPGAQRTAALRAANAILAVPAPTCAADIDKLEPWQVLLRSTRTVKGVQVSLCVTTDGRKYSFPIAAPVDLPAMNKAQLVTHALEVHGIELDPNLKKDEMIAAIAEKASK